MSVPDMLGSPAAVGHWDAFYWELTATFGFAKKAAVVGLSLRRSRMFTLPLCRRLALLSAHEA